MIKELEKLETAKAAWSVFICLSLLTVGSDSLLGLIGTYWN